LQAQPISPRLGGLTTISPTPGTPAPPYIPPAQRRIQAATKLLANPPQYDPNPVFAKIPRHAWGQRRYQHTLTVQWSGADAPGPDHPVRAHVHYQWNGNAWRRFPGNAWISGVKDWQTKTPPTVVDMAPALPSDPGHHP
jgi:hypothetical protein